MQEQGAQQSNQSNREELRLQKIKSYELEHQPNEQYFDQIVSLAAHVFGVENAVIAFLTLETTFIKAQVGHMPDRDHLNQLFQLAHTNGASVAKNIGDKNSFYAVSPLSSPEGYLIGMIMVHGKGLVSEAQQHLAALTGLGTLLMDRLETKAAIRKTLRTQDDRLHMLIHDLKNPLTTISLQSELIGRMPDMNERAATIAGKVNQQSKTMLDHLNEILTTARRGDKSFKPQKLKVDIVDVVKESADQLEPVFQSKRLSVQTLANGSTEIFGDKEKLVALFFQILHNSAKFSYPDQKISVSIEQKENWASIAIKDQGVGLLPEDLDQLFTKFSTLSSVPTNNENGNGLGLIIAKMMVDLHKGKLWAESDGKDQGTTFFIDLPIR